MDLFRRIKKYRVDGSGGSSANPVPDYYGEKIDSVRAYRNWMKDQRAFNKKRQNYF
jgi:import inner membrane translocase subunit TIM23